MRQCGGCTLCCKLVPVEELRKLAGARCAHQRTGKGCTVYPTRPVSCREWSCMWLVGIQENGQALSLSRPDRTHYVIDSVPDIVRVTYDDGSPELQQDVMQVWVDPLYPDAHEDLALRRMLDDNGIIALVRYNTEQAFTLCPPSRSADHQWHQTASQNCVDMIGAQREARFKFWARADEQALGEKSGPAARRHGLVEKS
jgi:hypothetical protein